MLASHSVQRSVWPEHLKYIFFFVAYLDSIGSGLDVLPLVDGLNGFGLALRTEECLAENLASLRV